MSCANHRLHTGRCLCIHSSLQFLDLAMQSLLLNHGLLPCPLSLMPESPPPGLVKTLSGIEKVDLLFSYSVVLSDLPVIVMKAIENCVGIGKPGADYLLRSSETNSSLEPPTNPALLKCLKSRLLTNIRVFLFASKEVREVLRGVFRSKYRRSIREVAICVGPNPHRINHTYTRGKLHCDVEAIANSAGSVTVKLGEEGLPARILHVAGISIRKQPLIEPPAFHCAYAVNLSRGLLCSTGYPERVNAHCNHDLARKTATQSAEVEVSLKLDVVVVEMPVAICDAEDSHDENCGSPCSVLSDVEKRRINRQLFMTFPPKEARHSGQRMFIFIRGYDELVREDIEESDVLFHDDKCSLVEFDHEGCSMHVNDSSDDVFKWMRVVPFIVHGKV